VRVRELEHVPEKQEIFTNFLLKPTISKNFRFRNDLGEIRGKTKGPRKRMKCGNGQRIETRDV
jgi:hypothetical protein